MDLTEAGTATYVLPRDDACVLGGTEQINDSEPDSFRSRFLQAAGDTQAFPARKSHQTRRHVFRRRRRDAGGAPVQAGRPWIRRTRSPSAAAASASCRPSKKPWSRPPRTHSGRLVRPRADGDGSGRGERRRRRGAPVACMRRTLRWISCRRLRPR